MFSFHKPKIYRSLKGCCICRAKSSSSRFTDSKRYETDFEKCFRIFENRSGEICNACVLLVKRWKKLPVGSTRNWHHVVDARAGPGTKSIMKMKAGKNKEDKQKKKHKHKKVKHNKPPHSPGGLSDDVVVGDDCQSDNSSQCSGSPAGSDASDDEQVSRRSLHSKSKRTKAKPIRFSSFLDLTYWKKTEVCCGIIFKGVNGEVLVDMSLLHPCRTCKPASDSNGSHSELSSQQSSPLPEEACPEPEPQPDDPAMDHAIDDGTIDDAIDNPLDDRINDAIDPGDDAVDEAMDTLLPTEDDDYDDAMEDEAEITSQEESQDSIIKSDDAQFLTEAVLDLSIPKHELIPTPRSITAEM